MAAFNAHALVVGIAAYDTLPALSTSVLNDARAMNDVLIDPQRCAYPAENVQCLLDAQATYAATLKALQTLADRTDKDSTVLIYFSGHGGHVAQGPLAGNYMMPVDARWQSHAMTFERAIPGDEFTQALGRIPARKLTVMLDCCHAGGIGQPKGDLPSLKAGLSEEYYSRLQQGNGRVILASSLEGEYSWIAPDAPHSVFTYYLLEGLRGGAAGKDGYVRILDLFSYVQPRVPAAEPRQHPLLKAEVRDNFAIALGRGGVKEPTSADPQGFLYDAYLCFADDHVDREGIEQRVLPRLRDAGLRLAVRYEVEEVGAYQLVEVERIVNQAKYTVIFMSPAYFEDPIAEFTDVLIQTLGVMERSFRLKPVLFAPMGDKKIPSRLSVYVTRDLTRPDRFEPEIDRLVESLKRPLPGRSLHLFDA